MKQLSRVCLISLIFCAVLTVPHEINSQPQDVPSTPTPKLSKDAATYNDQGKAHADKGEYTQAIVDFTQAITLDPRYAMAYLNIAQAYERVGRLSEALDAYLRFHRLIPRGPLANANVLLELTSQRIVELQKKLHKK